MDYAFVNAINFVNESEMVMIIYDIVCKFIANFEERRTQLPDFLATPLGLQIKNTSLFFEIILKLSYGKGHFERYRMCDKSGYKSSERWKEKESCCKI